MKPQIDVDERRCVLNNKTELIIRAAFRVSNVLGSGFLEKVYENALSHELSKSGLSVCQQAPIEVVDAGLVVGQYVADILVDDEVLVEVKAIKCFDEVHPAQCLYYLKATQKTICLLINFGTPKVEIKRIVHNY